MALLCFSMLVALVGVGFLVAALYMGLTNWLSPAEAAAATGVIMLVVTLILLAICKALVTPSRPKPGDEPPDEISGLMREAAALGSVTRQLERTVQEHKPLVTASTFAFGFYLGVNPEARRSLGRALSDAASHGLDSVRRGNQNRH